MNIGNETEYLEFKRSISESKEGIASICAILNKHGKGRLYFGVKDNGEVLGQQIGKDSLTKLSQEISHNIKPNFYYEINQKQSNDNKTFIEIIFHGNHSPYSAYGRYYLRFHDEDRQMDNETLRQYYYEQRNDYSQWEKNNSFVSIDDIDDDLLSLYIDQANEKKRIYLETQDKRIILNKLGLLYDENTLNNAGNMLFSKNKPIQFKLAVFATTNRLTILDLHIFSGNIFECIDKGMQYYSSNIRWRADFVGKVQRGNIPEIPLIAIREILVNAFSHADYNSNTDFELDIYSDRVSIYSPGHFPKPYTPEMFVEQSLEPIPLNKTINNVLYKNGTIEQFSTGFERTFHECQKYHIQYDYTETLNGFRFTFYRPYAEKTKENFSEMEQKVLNLIQENEHITIKNMAQKCLVSDRTIQRIINKLKNKNLIIRMGDNKTGKWQIVK